MARVIGSLFIALLVGAHWLDPTGRAYRLPLSMFRDELPAWIGYTLFGLLLSLGLATARTAWRVRCYFDAAVYLMVTALLAVVANTPSLDDWHLVCALGAMSLQFAFFALRLHWAGELGWLLTHLAVPTLLVFITRLDSYGIWQKGMIVYFVLAILAHEAMLAEWLPRAKKRRGLRRTIRIGRKLPPPDAAPLPTQPPLAGG